MEPRWGGIVREFAETLEELPDHQHLVRILGFCKKPAAVVCELYGGSDLNSILRSTEKRGNFRLWNRVVVML